MLLGPVQVNAQQAAAPPDAAAQDKAETALQEVVVTAQFNAASVQQTPLAITAVNAEVLAAKGQTSLLEITQDAPSVVLSPEAGGFGPSMAAFIRGIGQSDLDPALEPGVGIYVDDVYFGTLTGSMMDLLDLDRVEVLRGPQGTLEGMNSEGGSIKLFSKRPDPTDSTSVDLLVGSRNHVELRASVNMVLNDQLFLRLSGVSNHQDGYVNRVDFGCAAGTFTATDVNGVTGQYSVAPGALGKSGCSLGQMGGTDYQGVRANLRWAPNDRLAFNLIGDFINQDQEAPAETLIYAGPGANNQSAVVASAATLGLVTTNGHILPYNENLVPAIIPKGFYTSYASFCMPAVTDPVTIPGLGSSANNPAQCVDPRQTLQSWGAQLNTDWRISDGWKLKNIVAERAYSSAWVHDNDESAWPLEIGNESMQHHQFSEELRLSSSWKDLIDFTIGGFYFNELSVYYGHEDLWYAVPAFPGIFNFYQDDPISAHDKAGFLHTEFHITPKFDAVFGARYTSQDKEYHYVRLNPEGQTGGSATLVSSLNNTTSRYAANRADWRLDLDYHMTDDIMGYVQYSTGFKGGGVDPRPFYKAQSIEFQPESLATFESGIKTSWFADHVHANVDVYFSQYRDIQLTLADCSEIPSIAAASAAAGFNFGKPCALPFNAGAAHQKGVEFETEGKFGGFQVDGSLSWLKFQYVSINPATGVSLSDVTPFTPSWTANLGAQYTVAMGTHGTVTGRVDAVLRSLVYSAAVNDVYNAVPGYTLYNAHLTWVPMKGNWQTTVQVKNLAGKKYYANKIDFVDTGAGVESGNPGAPREIDLEVKHTM